MCVYIYIYRLSGEEKMEWVDQTVENYRLIAAALG